MSREGINGLPQHGPLTKRVLVLGQNYTDARCWFEQAHPGISHVFMSYVRDSTTLMGMRGETLHVTARAWLRDDVKHLINDARMRGLSIKEV
jgi:hypothetical protein